MAWQAPVVTCRGDDEGASPFESHGVTGGALGSTFAGVALPADKQLRW